MKRNICLILFFSITLSSIAQEKVSGNPKKIGLSLNLPFLLTSAVVEDVGDEELFAPQFGITYKKSAFYLGPTINGRLSGGVLTYQIFPNGFSRTFELFFQVDLIYQAGSYQYYNYNYTYTKVSQQKISNFYGYGFHLNGKRLFFTTCIGVGNSWNITNPPDYYYNDNTDFGGQITIGLGYNFSGNK